MDEYAEWARVELGISLNEDLTIQELPGNERGIFCTSDVPENSKLITIPFDSLLNTKGIRDTPLKPLEDMKLREDDLLSIFLLYEIHERGENSKWYRHLQLIPSTYHNIINYTIDELELIKGSNLYCTAKAWQNQVKNDYAMLLQQLGKSELESFRVEGEGGYCWFTYDNYLWALSTIWSRFVTVEMEEDVVKPPSSVLMFAPKKTNRNKTKAFRCMVPYFDMLNHKPAVRVSHYSDIEEKSLVLYTAQPFSANDEIYLNYGNSPNSRLLMLYGFVIPPAVVEVDDVSGEKITKIEGNPYDCVDIYAAMQPGAVAFECKSAILSEWDIKHASEPFKIFAQNGEIDGVYVDIFCN